MKKHCPYCGNNSGKEDKYGNCISCGGILVPSQVHNPIADAYQSGLMSPAELRRELITGSYTFGEYGQELVVSSRTSYRSIYDLPEFQKQVKMGMSHPVSHGRHHSYPTKEYYYGIDGEIVLKWRNAGMEGVPPQWFIDDPYPEHHFDWFQDWGK